jgi:glycosyl-4,4'-diaponeurosporenoate acyltransferase
MPFIYSLIYVIFLGIISHFIGESIPRNRFHPDKFPFKLFNWENGGELYIRIGIKKWKNKLPDMSKIMKDMVPKKVNFNSTASDVTVLIQETCKAELIHGLLCLVSPVIVLFWIDSSITVGIILTLVYVLFNIPFIIIQRFNRPNLMRLAERLSKREQRMKNENSDTLV